MPRNNANFNGYHVSYEGPIYSSLYGTAPDYLVHSISASHPDHGHVGHLYWHPETGEIKDVLVMGDHEGKGIASHMYNIAKQTASQDSSVPEPIHSADRTDAGDAWARKVGGALPPRSDRFTEEEY